MGRFSEPPVISVEPATPPVLDSGATEEDSGKPRDKHVGKKGKIRQRKSGPGDQVAAPENEDKIKRRDSKKLRSQKTDDGAKIPQEFQIGGPSKYPEKCLTSEPEPQPVADTRANNSDALTEKEMTVIAEVLSSRQTRSRTSSRSEGVVTPGED